MMGEFEKESIFYAKARMVEIFSSTESFQGDKAKGEYVICELTLWM